MKVHSAKLFAVAMSLAVLLTGIGTLPANAETPALAPTIDLANPTAGISDPTAGMTALDRNCNAGQVDVNTASAEQIGLAFGISSTQVLARIVAARDANEFLKATDLVSVPGVGPELLPTLAEKGCAAPRTLPPAPRNYCKADTSAVDLQTAPLERIATVIPLEVAQRLVAARPLSDTLSQVGTPRVEGLDQPGIVRLLKAGKVCITPAPFTYQGKSWHWVTKTGGGELYAVDDQRYGLIVPPNALSVEGAYASVTKLQPWEKSLPQVDAHIHGAWAGEVAVTLPPASDGETGSVIHETPTGPRFSTHGNVVAQANGSVVVAATSLSTFVAVTYNCTNPLNPICGVARDSVPEVPKGQVTGGLTDEGVCATSHPRAVAAGSISDRLACAGSVTGTGATWTIRNDTGYDMAGFGVVTSMGPVYSYGLSAADPTESALSMGDNSQYGLIAMVVSSIYSDSFEVIPPGYRYQMTKAMGDSPTTLATQGSIGHTAALATLNQLSGYIDDALLGGDTAVSSGLQTYMRDTFVPMIKPIVLDVIKGQEIDFSTLAQSFTGSFSNMLMVAWEPLDGRTKPAKQLKSASKYLGYGKVALQVADVAASVTQAGLDSAQHEAQFEFKNPPPPPSPGGGLGDEGLGGTSIVAPIDDGILLVRSGTRSFIVKNNRALRVYDSAQWACWTSGHFVRDWVTFTIAGDGTQYLDLPGEPLIVRNGEEDLPAWECTPGATWDYLPQPDGGNVPYGVLAKSPSGQTFLIDGIGVMKPVADLRSYMCLARTPMMSIFNFDTTGWAKKDDTPVTCG